MPRVRYLTDRQKAIKSCAVSMPISDYSRDDDIS